MSIKQDVKFSSSTICMTSCVLFIPCTHSYLLSIVHLNELDNTDDMCTVAIQDRLGISSRLTYSAQAERWRWCMYECAGLLLMHRGLQLAQLLKLLLLFA